MKPARPSKPTGAKAAKPTVRRKVHGRQEARGRGPAGSGDVRRLDDQGTRARGRHEDPGALSGLRGAGGLWAGNCTPHPRRQIERDRGARAQERQGQDAGVFRCRADAVAGEEGGAMLRGQRTGYPQSGLQGADHHGQARRERREVAHD